MQADQGAVERRVRNAAEAGAAAVLVSGTNLPAGSLDVEDGVAVPVVAIPPTRDRRRSPAARRSTSQSRALPNAQLMDIAAFSSGGVAFDGRVKPDLVAPGVGLATADAGGQGFATVTGSSAAAAVVAGAAARRRGRPTLTARELKSALVGAEGACSAPNSLPVTAQGAGSSIPSTPRPPRSPSSRRRSRSAGPRTRLVDHDDDHVCGTSPAGRSR